MDIVNNGAKTVIALDTTAIKDAVMRISDSTKLILYRSSRLKTMTIGSGQIEVDLSYKQPSEINGKNFELKSVPDGKIIATGKIMAAAGTAAASTASEAAPAPAGKKP
jgi:hypothetical protein